MRLRTVLCTLAALWAAFFVSGVASAGLSLTRPIDISALPPSPTQQFYYVVDDALDEADATVGGGTSINIVFWNGSAWQVALGGAAVGADHIDAITEIAAALKTGSDATVVTGTAGSTGDCAEWDANGDLVTAGAACGVGGGGGTVDDVTGDSGTTTGANVSVLGGADVTTSVIGDVLTITLDATITRDTEWDTLAEINAASTDTDAVLDTDIGVTVQAYDADLDDLADGSLTGSKVGTGISGTNVTTGTVGESVIDAAIARDSEVTSAIATQAAANVAIDNASPAASFEDSDNDDADADAQITVSDDASNNATFTMQLEDAGTMRSFLTKTTSGSDTMTIGDVDDATTGETITLKADTVIIDGLLQADGGISADTGDGNRMITLLDNTVTPTLTATGNAINLYLDSSGTQTRRLLMGQQAGQPLAGAHELAVLDLTAGSRLYVPTDTGKGGLFLDGQSALDPGEYHLQIDTFNAGTVLAVGEDGEIVLLGASSGYGLSSGAAWSVKNNILWDTTRQGQVARYKFNYTSGTYGVDYVADVVLQQALGTDGLAQMQDRIEMQGDDTLAFHPQTSGTGSFGYEFFDADGGQGYRLDVPDLSAEEEHVFGNVKTGAETGDFSPTAEEMRNSYIACADATDTCVVTLPTLASMRYATPDGQNTGTRTCFTNTNGTNVVRLDPNASDGIYFAGLNADGNYIETGSNIGDTVCLTAINDIAWLAESTAGTAVLE